MSRYKDALLEHENEDEDGKSKNVYAYFGLAVYHGQLLEESFFLMLLKSSLVSNKLKTNEDINCFIDRVEKSKKTMGNFINEVKQVCNLPEDIKSELNLLLDKRNDLVHKYFKENIIKFYSEIGQREMLEYFCDFIDRSNKIQQKLECYYYHHFKEMGLTEEIIRQLMDEQKKEEKERMRI